MRSSKNRHRSGIGNKRDLSMPDTQSNLRLEPISFKLEINEGAKKDLN